jgi:hypothetical protein
MTYVIAGQQFPTPLDFVCWLDDPKIPKATDGKPRKSDSAKAIVLHTVHGKVGELKAGGKPSARAELYARYQAYTAREVSWHFTIDTDGTIIQSADPALWTCWHAGAVNGWTVGIELVQDKDGTLYQDTLDACVTLCELLCGSLGITKQYPATIEGKPSRKLVPRLTGTQGPWSGVFGHRNQTNNRGAGDPGDQVFEALRAAGFQGVHLG